MLILAIEICATLGYPVLRTYSHSNIRIGSPTISSGTKLFSSRRERRASGDVQKDDKTDYVVGEGIPDDVLRHKCIYDMVLVERFSSPTKTSFGLFLPVVEGKDQKHLGKLYRVS